MKNENEAGFGIYIAIMVILWSNAINFVATRSAQTKKIQIEAVEKGHGEWETDSKGNSTFKWK